MEISVLVDGEGFSDVEPFLVQLGASPRDLVVLAAAKAGIPDTEALLFLEDVDEPLDLAVIVIEEAAGQRVHHLHRGRKIDAVVFYQGKEPGREFAPSARVQRVLDWAVAVPEFNIDPAMRPEMELALHSDPKHTPLPKNAHIGRYVRHPDHKLELDLVRGVVPNGGSR